MKNTVKSESMANKQTTDGLGRGYSVVITTDYSSGAGQILSGTNCYLSDDPRVNLVSSSARAIGLYGKWSGNGCWQFNASTFKSPPPELFAYGAGYKPRVWDPFNSDSDFLELCIELSLSIEYIEAEGTSFVRVWHSQFPDRAIYEEPYSDNLGKYAATKMAGVRAGADIGERLMAKDSGDDEND